MVLLLSASLLLASLPSSSSLLAPSSSTSTLRTDVWPDESSTAGGDGDGGDDHTPDVTSFLLCPSLLDNSQLQYNQSITCTIECRQSTWATAGKVDDYQWSAEAGSDSTAWGTGVGRSGTAGVKFGSVSDFQTLNDSRVISFTYTTPHSGSVGILRVMTASWAQEIENSPIVFTLSGGGLGNDTTPIVDPTPSHDSSSFVSLSNPAFIAVCAVAGVLLVLAVVGGVWARRVFARKADEVRERQDSERQWAHSVPSMKARLDVPHSSTLGRSTLHDPLLR